ncbi:MAG: DapH/DapD/GlmU-related protein [Anaerorhabdus sp.]|uniref:DapH/DapD/GlmU-related protein n=1 Tax=Anaerorhabdus sp. TaxID=1872524 RepID=UPI002FCC3A3B
MANKYSISELLSISLSLILTKFSYPQARLIRRPIYIRGKRGLEGAVMLTTGYSCRFDLIGDKKTLHIGEYCEIGDNVHVVAYNSVTIGDNVLIASKVFISDTSHGRYNGKIQDSPFVSPNSRELYSKTVEIGDNVWIGENVVILPGSKIGSGCIVGANSVVIGTIESECIAVGSPAKVIKKWNSCMNKWEKL